MKSSRFDWILFDWGGTLMYEDGPHDLPMASWPEVKAVPGAKEILSELSQKHRLGIATNANVSNRKMIATALERVSLLKYISEIFCFTEIGFKKDTLEFWQFVMRKLDVTNHDIAMVGDDFEQDILVPTRIGIYAVWFNDSGKEFSSRKAIPTIHSLIDLPRILARC